MTSTLRLSPDEKFSSFEIFCRDVAESVTIRIEQTFVFSGIVWNIIKMVSDDGEGDWISAVKSLSIGERKFCEHVIAALIPVGESCSCRDDHATAFDFGECDIAPPVHGDHFPIWIPNSSADEKES